jgi:hypothetical protein
VLNDARDLPPPIPELLPLSDKTLSSIEVARSVLEPMRLP